MTNVADAGSDRIHIDLLLGGVIPFHETVQFLSDIGFRLAFQRLDRTEACNPCRIIGGLTMKRKMKIRRNNGECPQTDQ